MQTDDVAKVVSAEFELAGRGKVAESKMLKGYLIISILALKWPGRATAREDSTQQHNCLNQAITRFERQSAILSEMIFRQVTTYCSFRSS
jgi:hypothetical protein